MVYHGLSEHFMTLAILGVYSIFDHFWTHPYHQIRPQNHIEPNAQKIFVELPCSLGGTTLLCCPNANKFKELGFVR